MANQKLTELTAAATVAATDIIYVVTTPGATPASRKATVSALVAGAGGPTTIPVPIAQGGTAGTTARLARDNLLLFDNTETLRWKSAGGTPSPILRVEATNRVTLNLPSGGPDFLLGGPVRIAGSLFLEPTNRSISMQDGASVDRVVLQLASATNILQLGNAVTPAIRALTAFEAASTITLENNTALRWKNFAGTAVTSIRLGTDNVLSLFAPVDLTLAPTQYVNLTPTAGQVRLGSADLYFITNNRAILGRTAAAVQRQMLKLNASDVLELGDAATPSIKTMTRLDAPEAVRAWASMLADGTRAAGHNCTTAKIATGQYRVTLTAGSHTTLSPVAMIAGGPVTQTVAGYATSGTVVDLFVNTIGGGASDAALHVLLVAA